MNNKFSFSKILVNAIFVWVLCVFSLLSKAQDQKTFDMAKLSKKQIKLPEPIEPILAIAGVGKILIEDARPDTAAIMLTKSALYSIDNFKGTLEKYFNHGLIDGGNNAERQLVVFVKKLWLTSQYKPENEVEEDNNIKQGNWVKAVFFKAECFLKTDSFYSPLFKYDTSLVIAESDMEQSAPVMIDSCLQLLAQKITRLQSKIQVQKLKKMTGAELDKYNSSRYALPILTKAPPEKGVYATFGDIKNNTPAYKNFTVQSNELSDQLYIKDSTGNEMLMRDIWGYSDGNNIYIKSADNYFMLKRYGNTFYVNGAKSVKTRKKLKASSLMRYGLLLGSVRKDSRKTKFSIEYLPYQLDIETGEIY